MWLVLRLLQKTLLELEQLSPKRPVAMLTELLTEPFVSLQAAHSQLAFGFPVEAVQRGRASHLPLQEGMGRCTCACSAELPSRLPAGTQTRGARGDVSRRVKRLTGCGAASPSAPVSTHCWWAELWNINSKLVCPGLPIKTTFTVGTWLWGAFSLLFFPHLSASEELAG